MIDRVIWVILDSVGMGELPDANLFGDEGANTLGHIFEKHPDINIPNMLSMGLGNIEGMTIIDKVSEPIGAYGKCAELSMGKDTTTGHWEMIGIHTPNPFPTYPNGFPSEIIDEFIKLTGCKGVLGNKVASGTEIIAELGDEHTKNGYPIIYTSADSVFQIAASEDVLGVNTLYNMCKIARRILSGKHGVGRVIARPFKRKDGEYVRTSNRRDFSLNPPKDNLLNSLKDNGYTVVAVGKIEDIFNGIGITDAVHTKDNMDGVDKTLQYMNSVDKGLIFTNLVEFDMKWGHRRDVDGYAMGLEEFDNRLPEIINNMKSNDLLIINADHGCDPAFKGTDHTREYIPVLMYGKSIKQNTDLGICDSFADIGQTIADIFKVDKLSIGESYIDKIL